MPAALKPLGKVCFVFTFLLINNYLFSQSWYPESIADTAFKYFEGVSEPDSDWISTDFDDSVWKTGYFNIGYGDDAYTVIDPVVSLYVRIPFFIEDSANINGMSMNIGFDDGFVAYINGIEFARVNLGAHRSKTTFDQLSDRSHEAQNVYNNTQITGYYIDDTIVAKHIKNGTNYLAIEVHNDSVNGSDLSLDYILYNHNGYYDWYTSTSHYKRSMELDSTYLPIIIVETNEYGIPYKRIEVPGEISIIDNGPGKYNKPSDSANSYQGKIEIELRGESSSYFPKQSFDFETQDEDGHDTSIAVLDLPKENDWILQGPYADRSQIRNALIYELGRKTGRWQPRVKFVELILNGEYLGLYNLIEKIKRDSARVNIRKLKEDEIFGNDLTGGYIVKYDKGDTELQLVYPKADEIPDEQESYIRDFFSNYHKVLYSDSGLDTVIGYRKYIDIESFLDYTIMSEFSKNCDAYLFSSYMYKDRDDINPGLQFGPLWDFDLCFGNADFQDGDKINEWQFDFSWNNRFDHKRLFQDPELVKQFADRWFEARKTYLQTDSVFALIDYLVDTLSEPIARNYQVWPVIDKPLFTNAYDIHVYKDDIDHIKQWITDRTTWIDENISDLYYPVQNYPSFTNEPLADNIVSSIYPNPFSEQFTITLHLKEDCEVSANLIAMNGKVVSSLSPEYAAAGNYKMHCEFSEVLETGIYILEIKFNNTTTKHYKVLKINKSNQ